MRCPLDTLAVLLTAVLEPPQKKPVYTRLLSGISLPVMWMLSTSVMCFQCPVMQAKHDLQRLLDLPLESVTSGEDIQIVLNYMEKCRPHLPRNITIVASYELRDRHTRLDYEALWSFLY